MNDNKTPNQSTEFKDRLEKLKKIKELGVNPYPEKFARTHFSSEALELGEKEIRETDDVIKDPKNNMSLAGRIMTYREHGKISFANLQDFQGKIQICFMQDVLGEETYKQLKLIDNADHIGVSGELIKTKHGEITLLVTSYELLSKTLRPLPEKFHGLSDQETKYRQRYLDLISDETSMQRFMLRTKVISTIRRFLEDNNFIEVETPVLQTQPSGAVAKPFITHHNSLDIPAYLRIAPETYLKRLIVGGFDRVFEFARCFRNEGMDPSHLQEFTMLEYYAAYWNYENNMDFTEKMIQNMMLEIFGTLKITILDQEGNPQEIDFKGPWPRLSYREIIKKDSGIDIEECEDKDTLVNQIKEKGIELEFDPGISRGNLVDVLYKKVSRPKLIQPAFVINHPADTKPLARRNDKDGNVCDTFQLLVNTWEIVNAYSEIVDPLDQRRRFEQQAEAKAAGDEEAMDMDEDYLAAMEHGMPPNSGWGMGIDRLVALLTQQPNLRDVVLFPFMRPTSAVPSEESYKPHQTASSPQANDQKITPEEHEKKPEGTKAPQNSIANQTNIQEAGISRAEAMALIEENIKTPGTVMHSREAEVVLMGLAKHLGQNQEAWGIAGLLHDLDWEQDEVQKDFALHGINSAEILESKGVNPDIIHAIRAHNYQYNNVQPETDLDFAVICGEQITGLIYATALINPDKKLASVKVKSILKRMKKKDFARNVDRDRIADCEKLGLSVEEFIEIALKSMQAISDEIGL
ncbi:lysine--tRNA ligase [Patescibacteria group bacterium]|nr:lysine--tRNA ligase [Patescibacteria group bacterium]